MEEAKDIIRGGPVGHGDDDGDAERDVGEEEGGGNAVSIFEICGTVSYCEDYRIITTALYGF